MTNQEQTAKKPDGYDYLFGNLAKFHFPYSPIERLSKEQIIFLEGIEYMRCSDRIEGIDTYISNILSRQQVLPTDIREKINFLEDVVKGSLLKVEKSYSYAFYLGQKHSCDQAPVERLFVSFKDCHNSLCEMLKSLKQQDRQNNQKPSQAEH